MGKINQGVKGGKTLNIVIRKEKRGTKKKQMGQRARRKVRVTQLETSTEPGDRQQHKLKKKTRKQSLGEQRSPVTPYLATGRTQVPEVECL